MANFDINTGTVVDWDSLSGGSTDATQDVYTISDRSTLRICTDTYQCVNHDITFGSLDRIQSGGTGGTLHIDGMNVRQIPFSSGTGTVPAINTTISQGGVSGPLLGIWADWQSEPLGAGDAMPSSGYIKIREVTGGTFAAGALTGISASATGSDETSWIEVRANSASEFVQTKLLDFVITGLLFQIGVTNGSPNQVITCPTTATSEDYFPGIWIEDAPSSGVFKRWHMFGSFGSIADMPDDEVFGRRFWHTSSGIRIGYDGTMNSGYVPPSGCRVMVPNVFLTTCTRSGSGSGPRVDPTTATYNFGSEGTKASVEGAVWLWDSAAEDSDYSYCVFIRQVPVGSRKTFVESIIGVSKAETPVNWITVRDLSINGLTIARLSVDFDNTQAALWIQGSKDGVINDIEVLTPDPSGSCFAVTDNPGILIDGVVVSGYTRFSNCSNGVLKNVKGAIQLIGTADSGSRGELIQAVASGDFLIDGIEFPIPGKMPREYIVSLDQIVGEIRNIGTPANPIDCENQAGKLFAGSFCEIKRCYVINTRNNHFQQYTPGVHATNCGIGYSGEWEPNDQVKHKGHRGTWSGGTQNAGEIWHDNFPSTTTGEIHSFFYEQPELTISSGSAYFGQFARVYLTTLGDQIIVEQDYFALGHEAADNVDPVSGLTSDFSYEFQWDLGAGYNGTWTTLTQANWYAVGAIDPSVGIRIKYRITCVVAATNADVSHIKLSTISSSTAQENNLYPLDVTIITLSLTDLQVNSEIRIYETLTGNEIVGIENSTDSFIYEYLYSSDIDVYVVIFHIDYKYIKIDLTLSDFNQNIPIQQQIDRVYANPT